MVLVARNSSAPNRYQMLPDRLHQLVRCVKCPSTANKEVLPRLGLENARPRWHETYQPIPHHVVLFPPASSGRGRLPLWRVPTLGANLMFLWGFHPPLAQIYLISQAITGQNNKDQLRPRCTTSFGTCTTPSRSSCPRSAFGGQRRLRCKQSKLPSLVNSVVRCRRRLRFLTCLQFSGSKDRERGPYTVPASFRIDQHSTKNIEQHSESKRQRIKKPSL